jgi:hypothetical protein
MGAVNGEGDSSTGGEPRKRRNTRNQGKGMDSIEFFGLGKFPCIPWFGMRWIGSSAGGTLRRWYQIPVSLGALRAPQTGDLQSGEVSLSFRARFPA